MFKFELKKEDQATKARLGLITTTHGQIKTPVFMPVGTLGTVKTLSPEDLCELGVEIILGNTYHLYLRPGMDVLKEFGGLHNFMQWDGPILTDSGGYQIFSLGTDYRENMPGNLVKIKEDGAEFTSHIDGSKHFFTPEGVIDYQLTIGSDIMMPLDFCPSAEADKKEIEKAVDVTSKWFKRAWEYYEQESKKIKNTGALFAIIQGGTHKDLREESFEDLNQFPVFGFAIGGVANAGESREKQREAVDATIPLIPKDKPRYLMGVGEPIGILEAVERGVDMFDSVMPTRIARNGAVWTSTGRINLRNGKYKFDKDPIEIGCGCKACQKFSKGYLHHLIKNNEILGMRLTTMHNVHFLIELMSRIRKSIEDGNFKEIKANFLKEFSKIKGSENRF